MPNSQKHVSPEQLAANRANAAHSTGPRSLEGKIRAAQNAHKHGFASGAYTVVRLEDLDEVADLKDDAVAFYQPVNSQELFAVERIALTQQAMLRAARLEAGLFTSCLNEAFGLPDLPLAEMHPDLLANISVLRAQNRNFLLAEGFQHSAAKSNALSLCLRYSAQAERQYRRAVEEFDRLKALRPQPGDADIPLEIPNEPAPQPGPSAPAAEFDETNPNSSEPPQNEELAGTTPSQSESHPTAFPDLAEDPGVKSAPPVAAQLPSPLIRLTPHPQPPQAQG